MQGTNEAERGTRSVVWPRCAYLVFLHWYRGQDGIQDAPSQAGSLLRLTQRFTEDVMQAQGQRVEQKWRRKWKHIKAAA